MPEQWEIAESRQPEERSLERQAAVPGLWPCAAIMLLSGICCWVWLTAARTPISGNEAASGSISELMQVDSRDLTPALASMTGSPAFLNQFKEREGQCARPLAWVSVERAPGSPPTRLRLRSGTYFSPLFTLSDVRVRVAVPYPGPYATGHGLLTAMDEGGNAVVSLMPAWHVSARDGQVTRDVVWTPHSQCKLPNG